MNQYADIIINRKSPAVDRVFTYAVPEHLREKICRGMLVKVPFNREWLEGVVVELHDNAPEGVRMREIGAPISQGPLFSQELLQLAEWMSAYYFCSRAAALQAMLPAGMSLTGQPPRIYYRDHYSLAPGWVNAKNTAKRTKLIQYLQQHKEALAEDLAKAGFARDFLRAGVKAGLLKIEKRRYVEDEEAPVICASALSPEQQAVLEGIIQEQRGANRPYLLHGVTGSGKTELYLRLIRYMAEQGKQSIVLVPEIALSTQMVEMLASRLELPVALLHSGLKASERRYIWQEIAEGRISCVVGARSAVFAPLPRLGLIVIDEAHENSYKQDNTPRFSALTVAEKRASLVQASLLLGSATPSVEQSYAADQGRYARSFLLEQYHTAPRPWVEVVDMREELKNGNKSIFSHRLQQALDETLQQGQQSILFLNRRGYYLHFSCRDCGSSITCPHCAVAMSFHEDAKGGSLVCHYCGASQIPPQVCPVCGSKHIRKFGVGTQRVADELTRRFPTARIARLDSDAIRERGSHARIYHAMRAGEIDILVGTQMVAKGLDFPKLALAAVVSADILLNLPDWRAAERTYQLITQLIGRAGRRDTQGHAIIQTYTPQAPPIQTASAGDYDAFYRAELEERRLHGYPPFSHLIRILMTANEHSALLSTSLAFAHYLREALPEADELCGPADAPLARIKDRFRRQIILKCGNLEQSLSAVEKACTLLRQERLARDFLLSVDVDPFSVM